MRLAFATAIGAACLLTGFPARAAEYPPADLSIEYGFNRITNGDGLNMPVGAAASLGLNVNDRFAVALDVRWNHKSEGSDSFDLMSFQAGPRLVFRNGGATPYLQAVAGAARASDGSSETKFCAMPGVGVDIRISERVKFRLGADFRLVFLEDEDEKDLLAHAGLVFTFGR